MSHRVDQVAGGGLGENWLSQSGIAVEEPGCHVWCSSPVIGLDRKTHLFVSRRPVKAGFGGWITDCEIARYVSDNPEGPFVFQGVDLSEKNLQGAKTLRGKKFKRPQVLLWNGKPALVITHT